MDKIKFERQMCKEKMNVVSLFSLSAGILVGISITIVSGAIGTYTGGGEIFVAEIILSVISALIGLAIFFVRKPILRFGGYEVD